MVVFKTISIITLLWNRSEIYIIICTLSHFLLGKYTSLRNEWFKFSNLRCWSFSLWRSTNSSWLLSWSLFSCLYILMSMLIYVFSSFVTILTTIITWLTRLTWFTWFSWLAWLSSLTWLFYCVLFAITRFTLFWRTLLTV